MSASPHMKAIHAQVCKLYAERVCDDTRSAAQRIYIRRLLRQDLESRLARGDYNEMRYTEDAMFPGQASHILTKLNLAISPGETTVERILSEWEDDTLTGKEAA